MIPTNFKETISQMRKTTRIRRALASKTYTLCNSSSSWTNRRLLGRKRAMATTIRAFPRKKAKAIIRARMASLTTMISRSTSPKTMTTGRATKTVTTKATRTRTQMKVSKKSLSTSRTPLPRRRKSTSKSSRSMTIAEAIMRMMALAVMMASTEIWTKS